MLKQRVDKINRTLDYILAYLKNKLQEEGADNMQNILKDYKAFKPHQSQTWHRRVHFWEYGRRNDKYKSEDLNILLAEIYAFDLPIVGKNIRDYLLPK